MRRLRLVVHALDRTGPPVLARTFAWWLAEHHPDLVVDLVAFRGGPLAAELPPGVAVLVLLDPHERWDHRRPDPARVATLTDRASALAPADATLLVSVAAAQALPLLAGGGAVVTWVVEQGEDLHWLDAPLGLGDRTDRWLAGAHGSRDEVADRLGGNVPVGLAPEFVPDPDPAPVDPARRQRHRAGLGAHDDAVLVVGAGIATHRKAPDLFVEVALELQRRAGPHTFRFAWIGGDGDVLLAPLARELRRLGLDGDVRMVPAVADLVPLLAAADVFLHPARLDAYPLVCLHAATVATPVVGFAGVAALEEMFGPAFLGAPYPDVAGLADVVRATGGTDEGRRAGLAQQAEVLSRSTVATGGPVLHDHLVEAVASRGAA